MIYSGRLDYLTEHKQGLKDWGANEIDNLLSALQKTSTYESGDVNKTIQILIIKTLSFVASIHFKAVSW